MCQNKVYQKRRKEKNYESWRKQDLNLGRQTSTGFKSFSLNTQNTEIIYTQFIVK
jgi:hypothetical protein